MGDRQRCATNALPQVNVVQNGLVVRRAVVEQVGASFRRTRVFLHGAHFGLVVDVLPGQFAAGHFDQHVHQRLDVVRARLFLHC